MICKLVLFSISLSAILFLPNYQSGIKDLPSIESQEILNNNDLKFSVQGMYENECLYNVTTKYEEEALIFKFNVHDEYVYLSQNILDGDYAQIYVEKKTYQPAGLIPGGTYSFVINPLGNASYGCSVDPFGKINFSPYLNGEGRILNPEEEGYKGYEMTLSIPYSLLNGDKDDLYTFAIFAKNQDSNYFFVEKECNLFNSCLFHACTHIQTNKDGTFAPAFEQFKNIILGDTFANHSFFKIVNTEFKYRGDFFAFGGDTPTIDSLSKCVDTIVSRNPERIFLNIGVEEVGNGVDVQIVIENLIDLFTKIHSKLPDAKIYWINICLSVAYSPYNAQCQIVNKQIEKYIDSVDYIELMDFRTRMLSGESTSFFDYLSNGIQPNVFGYHILTSMIFEILNEQKNENETFGSVGDFITSKGYDLSDDDLIHHTGWYDSYAFFKNSGKKEFNAEARLSFIKAYNSDKSPKIGMVVKTRNTTYFFYMNPTVKGKLGIGLVEGNNYLKYGWHWIWKYEKIDTVQGQSINNGSFAKIFVTSDGDEINFGIDEDIKYTVKIKEDFEFTYVGFLGFNSEYLIKEASYL